jgi:hypothetical protein
VLAFRLTGGNVHDSRAFVPLLDAVRVPRLGAGRPRTRPDYLLADKAYSSRAARALLRRRGIAHTIAEPDDQKGNRRRRAPRVDARSASTPPAMPRRWRGRP